MRGSECAREIDVLESLQASQWPEYCPRELREHVSSCESCRELVDVASALLDEHHHAVVQAPVPSSAIVWWRAQLRARQEAARAATRPITVVQGLSLACALGVLAAVAGFVSPEFRSWFSWTWGAAASMELPSIAMPAIAQTESILTHHAAGFAALGGLMLLVMVPIVLYVTFSE
jgi:hypothetical protein